MIVVQGYAQIDPADMPALRAAAALMVAASTAEPGCLAYGYGEDVLTAGHVHVSERWESWAALEAHFQTPHMAAFNTSLQAIKVLDAQVIAYEAGAARVLMGR